MKNTFTIPSLLKDKMMVLAFLIAGIFLTVSASAQYNLEFDINSSTNPPNGPSVLPVEAELRLNNNSTFSRYTPDITVKASYTTQTYNNVSNNVTGTGMQFGVTQNTNGKTPLTQSVWIMMGNVSSPANNMFTGNPYGTGGTGLDVNTNYAFSMFCATRPLEAANLSTGGRHLMGQLTLTFSRPVSNPVLHIVGLGGSVSGSGGTLGFSTELDMTSTGVSLAKLSGSSELNVTSTQILNGASNPGGTSGSGAATGSVRVTGDNITALVFNVFMRGDGDGDDWETSNMYAGDRWLLGFTLSEPTVSGKIYDDANGLIDNAVNGIATNAAGSLYVNLVDATTGYVAKVAKVADDGNYLFQDIQPAGFPRTYTAQLSSTPGTKGAVPPATTLPAGYTHTGCFLGTGNGGSNATPGILGSITLANTTTVIKNANFGLDQIPVVTPYVCARVANPGGTTQITIPFSAYSGSDAEDGSYPARLAGKKVTLNPATNGTLYYKGNAVTVAVTDAAFDPSQVKMDPAGTVANAAVNTSFSYLTYDAADKPSLAKTVTLPVDAGMNLSGNVWDDANGNATKVSESFTNAGGLNAVLTDNFGHAIESVAVNALGSFAFTRATSSETYKIVLTTGVPTIGELFSSSTLPAPASGAWVNTGVNLSGSASIANKTGIVSVTTPATGNVNNQNFGIEQTPVADAKAFTAPHSAFTRNIGVTIGGVETWSIPAGSAALSGTALRSLSGTDMEDCSTASSCNTGGNSSFYIATVNSNTLLYYNGAPVAANSTISNFNLNLLTIYGKKGQGSTVPNQLGFTYSLVDKAGIASPAVSYSIQTSAPLPLTLISFGAKAAGCHADIYWNSASELNGDYYAAERSEDGIAFREFARLSCQKTGATYSTKAEGVAAHNYFRLKRVEVDGTFDYSETIALHTKPCSDASVTVAPNPAQDYVIVSGLEASGGTIMLFNGLGSLVHTQNASGETERISLSGNPAGIYMLQVVSADGSVRTAFRLVKE